ncbi:MAG: response regulator [Ekhidna sp.]|nr:response regulator [Ekhidna sp.]
MSPDNPTILYVDDDYFNITLFELNFKSQFNVVSASSGEEALRIMTDNPKISCVVSDMRMPEINGIELINRIKKLRPELPCFLLTGYVDSQEVVEAIEKNLIIGYFNKPFDREAVIRTLKSTINAE